MLIIASFPSDLELVYMS